MKAFTINPTAKVHVYTEPVHMAASFEKLMSLAESSMKRKVTGSPDLFLFVNKRRTYVKVLWAMKGGHCIFAKRVEAGIFDAENLGAGMSVTELQRLVDDVVSKGSKRLRHLKSTTKAA